jgi:hypothetical protein
MLVDEVDRRLPELLIRHGIPVAHIRLSLRRL